VDVSNPGLNVGENLLKLTCIAESGEMRIYTITVTREEKSAESENSEVTTGILKDPMFYTTVTFGLVTAAVAVILIRKRKIKLL
jgi:hypothetical protein